MQENNPAMFPQNPNLTANPKETPNHIKSIIFILLASLPLLSFMILFEIFLEKNLIELIRISIPPSQDFFNILDWPIPNHLIGNLTWDLSQSLICLSLMYIPLSILELISMAITTDLASRMYKSDGPVDFKDFVSQYKSRERSRGLLTTVMCVLFLSVCGFFGLLCFTMVLLYTKFESFFVILVSRLVYPLVLLALLLKYLELSVVWNLSLVVSVLEEEYGAGSFALSFYFSKGNRKRGIYLMLGFLFVGVGLRIPCFYVNDGWIGIMVRTSLLWVVDLLQWLSFVVYYHECKSRVLQKKINPEVSKDLINDVA